MENKSFKHYFIEWQKVVEQIQGLPRSTFSTLGNKRRGQLERAKLFYEEKMATFGSGTLVEITGQLEIKIKNRPHLSKLQNFRLFMVNTDADEAKEYFEKIVKLKYSNVLEKTIQIKQLPVGVIQIN